MQQLYCSSISCLFKGSACEDCCSPTQCGLLRLKTEILSRLRELGLFDVEKRRLLGRPHCSLPVFKGSLQKNSDFLYGQIVIGNGFELKNEKSRLDVRKGCLEHSEALARVVWRSCGYLIPESAQGQIGWGPEQPGLVSMVEVGTR